MRLRQQLSARQWPQVDDHLAQLLCGQLHDSAAMPSCMECSRDVMSCPSDAQPLTPPAHARPVAPLLLKAASGTL